jgi:hypothetical protein
MDELLEMVALDECSHVGRLPHSATLAREVAASRLAWSPVMVPCAKSGILFGEASLIGPGC